MIRALSILKLEIFKKAIQINPNNARLYHERGLSYDLLQQYDRSIENYTKAIQLNPNNPDVYYSRGIVFDKLEQYDKAISDFDQAIQINPDAFYAYLERAYSYIELAHYDLVIKDFKKTAEINPGSLSESYYGMALSYDKWEKSREALKYYQLFLDTPKKETLTEEIEKAKKRIIELSAK